MEREEPVTYLFMGDSITHGVMTDGYDNVPQIFAKYLNEAGRNDIVLNTGVANATLSTTLDQVEHRLTNYDPDVVFVMLGTNDASTRGEILPGDPRDGSVESFKLRYLDLIQNIYQHRKDTKVVLRVPCEMIPDDARSNYKAYFDAIDDVAEQARQTCPGMEICVVDHKAAWNKYTENVRNDNLAYGTDYGWLKDNVHPNGRGNMAMFQQLVRELGIYRPTSDIANYQFALDAWEKESEIRVTVVRNETDAAFDMDGLTGYADGLKTVTVALTDDTGRCFSKTEVYEEGGRITLTGLDAGGKYTAEVSGKDAETGKKVMFRTTLVKEDAEGIREERERLKEVLQQADEKKPEEFGTVGWDTFQTAKEEARKASDKTDITARELAAAREALLAAMEKLIPVNQKEGNPLRLDETKRYLIYNVYDQNHNAVEGTERALFDDGGQNVGWLKYDDGFEQSYSEKYIWQVRGVPGKSDQYYLRNLGTGFAVMDLEQQAANKDYRYVVSDKNKNNTGDPYTFVIREVKDGKYYVTLEAVRTGKVVAPENGAGDRTYAIFSEDESDKNNYWCIEEAPEIPEVPGQRGKTILWDSPVGNDYYRIPAITTANNGDLVAVTDYRYDSNSDLGDNWPGHPRGHQIDLITRTSEDNGKTWSDSNNLTAGYSIPDNGVDRAAGFGDAAVVADRESDEILLLCASGTYGFINTDRKIRSSMMTSEDNGATWSAPAEIADKIYGLNEDFKAFFFASGRIMQSRYIKVKDHYRIYSAILAHPGNFNEKSNWVVYSDDFGKTWEILGNEETACVPGGDEAKIEELPDGSVLISSRKDNGRYINVFCYDETDETYTRGSWGNVQTLELGRGQGTNGEIMIVYAKEKDTGEYKYLALQSLPTGEGRTNVSIYYKELNPDQNTAEDFVQGWNEDQRFLVQRADSAYSTMTLQKDGKIAFFWEEGSDFYDMAYNSYSLEDITEGKYGMAFQGIGSVMSPYLVETQDQKAAVAGIFQNEKVNWKFVESEPE